MNGKLKLIRIGRGIERPAWLPEPRPPHLVLDEVGGTTGYVLWLLLNDCGLWISAELRAELFAAGGRDWARDDWPAELEDPFSILRAASAAPELARAPDLAAAAAAVWEWAERQGHMETALQFAELAARLEPESSGRAGTAGRLCRRRGALYPRATCWYSRAVRLARLQGDEIAFATAHLGWGLLEFYAGNLLHSEAHFTKGYRRAMRAGRHSLAGSAKHNLLAVAITAKRYEEAMAHANDAARLYAPHHPRFPLFVHDTAFLLNSLGYYSSALLLLDKVAPLTENAPERILVYATMSRAAGAVRDRVRYERAAAKVLRFSQAGSEMAASSVYHVAEGARCFEQWDRAAELGREALQRAEKWGNKSVVALSTLLLDALSRREQGDVDVVPPEGGEIDSIVALLLTRLRKHTAPRDRRAVAPERFPVY